MPQHRPSSTKSFRISGPQGHEFSFQRHPAADSPTAHAVLLLSGFGIHPRAFTLRSHCDWVAHWQAVGVDVITINLVPIQGDCTLVEQAAVLVDWCAQLRLEYGYSTLHGIGFSLGGLQWLAALNTHRRIHTTDSVENQRLLDSLTLVEVPVDLRDYPISSQARIALRALKFLNFNRIPYRILNPVLALVAPILKGTANWKKWANFANLNDIALSEIITQTFDDVPMGVALQLIEWIDGRARSYAPEALAGLPVLLVYGANTYSPRAKSLAKDLAVEFQDDGANPPQLTIIQCHRSAGFVADYGHADLLLGDQLRKDVLQHIQAWQHAGFGLKQTN